MVYTLHISPASTVTWTMIPFQRSAILNFVVVIPLFPSFFHKKTSGRNQTHFTHIIYVNPFLGIFLLYTKHMLYTLK